MVHAVRDRAFLPGPPGLWDSGWVNIPASAISAVGALMRSLCLLPGGLGRFVTCSIGANHCRLRHIGWEKCGHGLTSRPRESASLHFLDELLALFRYPSGSGRALLCLLALFPFGTVLLGSPV